MRKESDGEHGPSASRAGASGGPSHFPRPPRRTARLFVKVRPAEAELVGGAASVIGESVAEFSRRAVLREAQRVLARTARAVT
jgi:hypothetical protein